MFNLDASLDQLQGKQNVYGSVTIRLKDTLGGVHPLSADGLHFLLGRIGFMRL